jgi:hypothetical protein
MRFTAERSTVCRVEYPSAYRLSREELYELVWSAPVKHAAAQFGVSDVALAKACRRQQVPIPPRGYWARKAAGQPVSAPPLPDYISPPPKPKRLSAHELREQERKREAEEHARAISARFAHLPLVCFADDLATAIGVSKKRLDALRREGASPIPELPYFGCSNGPGLSDTGTKRTRRGLVGQRNGYLNS